MNNSSADESMTANYITNNLNRNVDSGSNWKEGKDRYPVDGPETLDRGRAEESKFWEEIERSSRDVESWPSWKKTGSILFQHVFSIYYE